MLVWAFKAANSMHVLRPNSSVGPGTRRHPYVTAAVATRRQEKPSKSPPRRGRTGFDPFRLTDDPRRSLHLREAEVLHARWAMLGTLGLIVPDILGGPLYLVPDLASEGLVPFTIQAGVALGVLEAYRAAEAAKERSLDARVYPGRRFDVLGLTGRRRGVPGERPRGASASPEPAPGLAVFSAWLGGLPGWLSGVWWLQRRDMTVRELDAMKSRELKNGRLAMVGFMGAYVASMLTGKGPITLLMAHLADPAHNTVLQTLGQ